MKLFRCILIGMLPGYLWAQPIVQVNTGTGLHLAAGSEVYLDGLVFYPNSGFTVPGENSVTRTTGTTVSLTGFSIGRVYEFNQPVTNYEGGIAIFYKGSELNGISGSQLKLLVFDGNTWMDFDPSTNDEINHFVKVDDLDLSSVQALTLGYLVTIPAMGPACTYSQGYYGNPKGAGCIIDGNGATTSSTTAVMLAAFGAGNAVQFGSIGNRRFFTLFKSDISNGTIFRMLPGTGNAQPIAEDKKQPYDGAYYDDPKTWDMVPIVSGGAQKGRINNLLLAQTITLWFNLRNSPSLAGTELVEDTLVTAAQAYCGSETLTGQPAKYGIPHEIIVYLNSNNGYSADVSGLFVLANDVLGGVIGNLSPSAMQAAVAAVNLAFDGCRILVGTIPFRQTGWITKRIASSDEKPDRGKLVARVYPNPFSGQFSLEVFPPQSGKAIIKLFTADGALIRQQNTYLTAGVKTVIPFAGPGLSGSLFYSVEMGNQKATGVIIGMQ